MVMHTSEWDLIRIFSVAAVDMGLVSPLKDVLAIRTIILPTAPSFVTRIPPAIFITLNAVSGAASVRKIITPCPIAVYSATPLHVLLVTGITIESFKFKIPSNNAACNSEGICTCNSNYFGTFCETFCDPLSTCSGNGYCNSAGLCSCNPFYFGSNCSVKCEHGQFENSTYSCSCDDDWYGDGCNAFCEMSMNCSGNGNCSSTGSCECSSDFYGPNCAVFCGPESCCNHGTCNTTTGSFNSFVDFIRRLYL